MAYPINYIAFSAILWYTLPMSIFKSKITFSHTRSEIPSPKTFTNDHFHNSYEIYFFLSGDVDYVVNDATYSLQPYDLLLIKSSVYHYPKILSEKPYERIVINFTPDAIDEELHPILYDERVRYRFENDKLVKRLFASLDEIKRSANQKDMLTFCRFAVNLLLLQTKYAPADKESPQIIHPTLSKILQYIDENLNHALEVTTIAKEFYVSPSWVFHIFKKHLQISYKQYVNHRKMLYAHQLVLSGTPPTQAALLCGFQEYTTFYRQYKRQFGVSPQEDKETP